MILLRGKGGLLQEVAWNRRAVVDSIEERTSSALQLRPPWSCHLVAIVSSVIIEFFLFPPWLQFGVAILRRSSMSLGTRRPSGATNNASLLRFDNRGAVVSGVSVRSFICS